MVVTAAGKRWAREAPWCYPSACLAGDLCQSGHVQPSRSMGLTMVLKAGDEMRFADLEGELVETLAEGEDNTSVIQTDTVNTPLTLCILFFL